MRTIIKKLEDYNLEIIMLCLTFYRFDFLPTHIFNRLKYVVLLWILFRYCSVFMKHKKMLIAVALYGLILFISSVYNRMPFEEIVIALMYGVQILDVYLVCIYYIHEKSLFHIVKVVTAVFLALLLVNDVLMIYDPHDYSNPTERYFIGNKFSVSYVHCFVSALMFICSEHLSLYLKSRETKHSYIIGYAPAVLFSIYSTLVCAKVTCSTGVAICAVLPVLFLLPKSIKAFISDGKVMVIGMAIISFLAFGKYSILSAPFVKKIVSELFDRSSSWHSRIRIWEQIPDIFRERPILGYGNNSGIVSAVVGFGNPQNGVLNLLIDTGVIGLILYAAIVCLSFPKQKKMQQKNLFPLIAFFYAMLAASIAEINLSDLIVYMSMAMYYAQSMKAKNEVIQ